MKRIILGLGVLLILAQNGVALDFNTNFNAKWFKQVQKCEDQTYLKDKANIVECSKAINMIEKYSQLDKDQKELLAESYMNMGFLYYYKSDYVNSYKNLIIGAKKGSLQAQKNLDILCRQHSWVCK